MNESFIRALEVGVTTDTPKKLSRRKACRVLLGEDSMIRFDWSSVTERSSEILRSRWINCMVCEESCSRGLWGALDENRK